MSQKKTPFYPAEAGMNRKSLNKRMSLQDEAVQSLDRLGKGVELPGDRLVVRNALERDNAEIRRALLEHIALLCNFAVDIEVAVDLGQEKECRMQLSNALGWAEESLKTVREFLNPGQAPAKSEHEVSEKSRSEFLARQNPETRNFSSVVRPASETKSIELSRVIAHGEKYVLGLETGNSDPEQEALCQAGARLIRDFVKDLSILAATNPEEALQKLRQELE